MIYESIVSRQPIHYGWSGDRKYRCESTDGKQYLLRISPSSMYERRKWDFERMQEIAALGIPMCLPVEFGTCPEGVYALHTWIDGQDAEAVLPGLSREKQYQYGLDAGQILRKIHSIPAPESRPDWDTYFQAKIDRKIRSYEECPLKYEKGERMLAFLTENRHLLKGRPQSLQHGDYHTGNMMIGQGEKLYIIDFEKADYGDPWEEFNRIVWTAQIAPECARGLVDGYFETKVPVLFWRLMALYICSNSIGSLSWAISYGDREVDVMLQQNKDILEWYDDMQSCIPKWYY